MLSLPRVAHCDLDWRPHSDQRSSPSNWKDCLAEIDLNESHRQLGRRWVCDRKFPIRMLAGLEGEEFSFTFDRPRFAAAAAARHMKYLLRQSVLFLLEARAHEQQRVLALQRYRSRWLSRLLNGGGAALHDF